MLKLESPRCHYNIVDMLNWLLCMLSRKTEVLVSMVRLLNASWIWSKEQGIFDLYLDVYAENEAAVKAYEKAGFSKSLVQIKIKLGI
jgi:hypothetical protein